MIDMPEWQSLSNSAIWRKHDGDIDGAIEEMREAIKLARTVPNLSKATSSMLNYLADLYLTKDAIDQAEEAILDAIELSRLPSSAFLGDNLLILAEVQCRKRRFRDALASAVEALHVYQQEGHTHGVSQAKERIERLKNNGE